MIALHLSVNSSDRALDWLAPEEVPSTVNLLFLRLTSDY